MAVVSAEIEIPSSLSASKLFEIFTNTDDISLKANPQTYESISIIQGDGGVGTIKSIKLKDGTSSKYKVEAIDTNNLMVTNTVFENEALLGVIDTATHHMKFIPSADGGSVYKHTVVVKFRAETDDAKTNDIMNLAKEGIKNGFKLIESYVIAHPEVY